MNKREKLLDLFLNQGAPVQVYPAEVLEVAGDMCTVRLLSSELEVDEVRLQADPDSDQRLVLRPAIGSTVLVGCVENEVGRLYVAQVSELESFTLRIGDMGMAGNNKELNILTNGCAVKIEDNKIEMSQQGVSLTLEGGKVDVKNNLVSLKDLFSDLATLLNTLIVITPSGPSTSLGPTSLTAVTQLTTKVNQLLK